MNFYYLLSLLNQSYQSLRVFAAFIQTMSNKNEFEDCRFYRQEVE